MRVVLCVLLRSDGHPSKHELRPQILATTHASGPGLYKGGSASLVVCGRCAGQDLSDPAPPGGTVAVLGWTGFGRCGLLLCLFLSQYVSKLLLGTCRPHRCTICWSVCGAIVEKVAIMGEVHSNSAGLSYPASELCGFG